MSVSRAQRSTKRAQIDFRNPIDLDRARSDALQTRDRANLWRSRTSGAPRARSLSRAYFCDLHALVLHRVRDTSGGAS
jgi:hypothetical protein